MSNTKQFGELPVEGSGQHEQKAAATETGSGAAEGSASGGLLQQAGEAAKDVKAFAVRKARDVRDVAEQKTERLVAIMKARPVESVLIGVAIGYLLGWLSGKVVQSRTAPRRRLFHKW
jgi:hypothetical protein